MLPIFKQLEEMFMGIKADDEADDEVDDETDDETDLPELETEESPEKRKKHGQEVKILIPKQLITSLPILLAQLRAGNNSEKFYSYSLYRSKKLSIAIYNSLMNTS